MMHDEELEARLHARTMAQQTQRQREWETRSQARKARLETWVKANDHKLVDLHPLIRAEVEGMAWDRIKADRDVNLTQRDIRTAEACVVSRRRVKAYGAQPEDYDEAKRQTNEIRANLGLPPLPSKPAQQAAE